MKIQGTKLLGAHMITVVGRVWHGIATDLQGNNKHSKKEIILSGNMLLHVRRRRSSAAQRRARQSGRTKSNQSAVHNERE